MSTRCLGAIALVLCSASSFPSESRALAVGSRVRVSAPEAGAQPLIGSVVGLEPHAVLVRAESSGAATRVPLGFSTTIEVSGGRRSKAGRGAVVGAAVGAMPGLLMTFGDYNADPEHSPGAVAALGAAAGAAVGAVVGWALKSEEWFPAEAPLVTAGVAPLRGGVGFSIHVAWGKGLKDTRP
jgi:membrane associated rhomboid family serine protease